MRLNRALIAFTIVLMASTAFGQYWQQYVEYDMQIYFDEEEKTLTSSSDLLYVNHSPDTLDQILMQLYHNAFNEGTIAEQVWVGYGEPFDPEKDWTGIHIDSVTTDSTEMNFIIRDDTILDITLPEKLTPGDTLRFTLKWNSIIHSQMDRSGYKGRQFDFAQWYPKFVVYDENGWHDDPFGDFGEFYGEFGEFKVRLNVPASHIVAATGIVVDGDPGWDEVTADTSQSWEDWQPVFKKDRIAALEEIDSTARRQVTFFAENVHDFAWNSSPHFIYEHDKWEDVDVHVLYDLEGGKDWFKNECAYTISAIEWLSNKLGRYPYPQVTTVHGLLGGGMEYPMLIMDGYHSEGLVLHEVGHIWFYGIFANDELDDAWLDEGFTTFQTLWYIEDQYPENDYYLTRNFLNDFEYEHLPLVSAKERDLKPVIEYMRSVKNEPLAQHSYDFETYNSYSTNVYDKGSMMLYSLKNYLGEERFLAGMQTYYDQWALKHVNEDRFIKSMESGSGEDLDWFFDQWLHTSKYVDYSLEDYQVDRSADDQFETTIYVENKGGLFVPIPATIYGAGGETMTSTLKEFKFRENGEIKMVSDFRPVRVELDKDDVFLDVDRRDNRSWGEREWRYNFKGWEAYPPDRDLFLWKPLLGFNDEDGLGLGLKIDRVYRVPGDFISLEIDHNLGSGNPDIAVGFRKELYGRPMQTIFQGEAGSWHQLNHASVEYELSWAKVFWENPVHYLTLGADYTDSRHIQHDGQRSPGFSRLGALYELQHNLLGGNLGFAANFKYSPKILGEYTSDFNQTSFMLSWTRRIGTVRVVNRSNFLNNSSLTPEIVKSRLGTKNLRSIHLDRMAQFMNGTNSISDIGSRYQLPGGGRMRAYTDSLNVSVDYAWSNNFDIVYGPTRVGQGRLSINTFVDVGQYSADGVNWTSVGDIGIGVAFTPRWERTSWLTTLIRPVTLKIDLPMARIESGSWEVSDVHKLWMFQITI